MSGYRVTSDSKKPDEREKTLRFYLGRLKEQARLCSNSTKEILEHHILFASLMARRIDDASKSQNDLKYGGPETTKLAKEISKASRSLSTNVTQMTNDLNLFVSALENIQIAVKTERLLAEDILRWLNSLLKAVASILAIGYPSISPLPPSAGSTKQQSAFPTSALREAAAKFCTVDPGAFIEHTPSPTRTEVTDSSMQNPRRGNSLRASTP
jgi:hypothetical protein